MTKPYAEGTSVPVERSRAELDALLAKRGASQRAIMSDEDNGCAAVLFVLHGRKYRLDIPMPKVTDDFPKPKPARWATMSMKDRETWREKERAQSERERWRAVVLCLKAKLELVRIGISSIEREFMADMVLPNGRTVAAMIESQIESISKSAIPRLLPENL